MVKRNSRRRGGMFSTPVAPVAPVAPVDAEDIREKEEVDMVKQIEDIITGILRNDAVNDDIRIKLNQVLGICQAEKDKIKHQDGGRRRSKKSRKSKKSQN
jgi:hypothetical protein